MIYHTAPLELLLSERHAKEIMRRRQENAFLHTQRLLIGGGIKHGDSEHGDIKHGGIEQNDIRCFLANAQKLQSVEYTYSAGPGNNPICPWKQVYDMGIHLRKSSARLYIDNFTPMNPMGETRKTRPVTPKPDISKSLVSLKMASTNVPHSVSALQILKKLLLRAPLLETFHYIDSRAPRVPGRQFNFEGDQRLPAFKNLTLKNYDWKHDAGEVKLHWDFSRIRSLALLMIPVYKFLESVPYSDLAQLQHLHAENYSEATEYHDPRRATKKLQELIKDHIKALQTLDIACILPKFSIDAILVHAKSLKSLAFRDHADFSNPHRHRRVLNTESLTILSKSMTLLETLEIDMDHTIFPEEWLSALCRFPRLHTLVLHTQTVVQTDSNHRPGQDPDLTRAYDTFTTLVRQRPVTTKWQRVVINVGGWRERDVIPRAGRRPRVRPGETYTYYRTCVSQRYFVLEESTSGQEDLIYEELPPMDDGLTHFHGNLRTGKSLELPQRQVQEDNR